MVLVSSQFVVLGSRFRVSSPSFFFAGDGDEANYAIAIFEDQAGALGVHDCCYQTAVGLGDAAVGRGLA